LTIDIKLEHNTRAGSSITPPFLYSIKDFFPGEFFCVDGSNPSAVSEYAKTGRNRRDKRNTIMVIRRSQSTETPPGT
jgi:hypothetical protein